MVSDSRQALRATGFGMMEMLIVIAIASLLLLAGVPLTRGWMADASIQQAESQLMQAYAKTKALALRNPSAASGSTPAATLRIINGNTVQVQEGASGRIVWFAVAGQQIQWLVVSDTASQLVACGNALQFDNAALPLAACKAFRINLQDGYSYAADFI